MLREGGYACIAEPTGTREASTFTCYHCNKVVHVKAKSNPDDFGSMCRLCMKMVCPTCANLGCTPFEKKIEALEKRDRALRSYGL